MHKAISILMFKLECQVIDRNPDFQDAGPRLPPLHRLGKSTPSGSGKRSILCGTLVPHGGPRRPGRTSTTMSSWCCASWCSPSARAKTAGACGISSTQRAAFTTLKRQPALPWGGAHDPERHLCGGAVRGHTYSGRALMDYCDERARRGYFAPEGSAARRSGQDFCGICGAASFRRCLAAVP